VISIHFDDCNEIIFLLAGCFEGGDDLVVVGGELLDFLGFCLEGFGVFLELVVFCCEGCCEGLD
jgi:hypothetical protein